MSNFLKLDQKKKEKNIYIETTIVFFFCFSLQNIEWPEMKTKYHLALSYPVSSHLKYSSPMEQKKDIVKVTLHEGATDFFG